MNESELYPLKFRPIYKEHIWGGRRLREFFNRDIPPGKKIGESWELADLPNDKSIIANGKFTGKTISWMVKEFPEAITGDKHFSGPFPLLIKFIDAQEVLSIQVHPDEKACRKIGSGVSKEECWYIISAAEDAVIYKGLKKDVTKEKFEQAIREGTVAELLVKIPVKKGQCHFLPAGTVHGIGAGLLIAEIQTPSDTTYRVFDWNRTDDAGKPRPLHIKEAIESITFDMSGEDLPATTANRLTDSEYFKIDKYNQSKNSELALLAGEMKCLIIVSGSAIIESGEKDIFQFRAGDTMLIPAVYKGQITFNENTEYLTVTI